MGSTFLKSLSLALAITTELWPWALTSYPGLYLEDVPELSDHPDVDHDDWSPSDWDTPTDHFWCLNQDSSWFLRYSLWTDQRWKKVLWDLLAVEDIFLEVRIFWLKKSCTFAMILWIFFLILSFQSWSSVLNLQSSVSVHRFTYFFVTYGFTYFLLYFWSYTLFCSKLGITHFWGQYMVKIFHFFTISMSGTDRQTHTHTQMDRHVNIISTQTH